MRGLALGGACSCPSKKTGRSDAASLPWFFVCVFGGFFSRARRLPSPIVILQDLEREEVLVSSASMQGGGGEGALSGSDCPSSVQSRKPDLWTWHTSPPAH